MSYITFNPNEVVYIRTIGYATLINCGSRNTISQKIEALPTKKESIYFDPDLFNSDIDSNNSKKSQSKSDEEKLEPKIAQPINAKKSEDELKTKIQKDEKKQEEETINIVQAKLEGSSAVIYTSEKHLSKTIFIVVKSLLINHKQQITVEIEITKTIDTLRKAIFQQLAEQIGSYYNIKLFATNPMLAELSVHTKTIHQYLIKDNDKLILTADYAFGFKTLPSTLACKTKITLNNNTLSSTKPPEEPKPIALPPPPPPPPLPPVLPEGEVKVEEKPQPKIQEKVEPPKVESAPVVSEDKIVIQNQSFHARCNIQLTSGRRYWEIKVEKVPVDENDLIIGVCIKSDQKTNTESLEGCSHAWSYLAVSGKKSYESRDEKGNILEDEMQNYGYSVKQNDIVGVLVSIRGKQASLTFYKNSISCGQAYSIDLAEANPLIPFVNIGGEAQISLDSKAQLPLDSFRKK